MPTQATENATNIDVVPRDEFLHDVWDHSPGQHVTMIGPTQRGKTHLCIQLLGQTISPDHRAVLLAGKPPKRDHVMTEAAKTLNLRVVETWPPRTRSIRDRNKNGYVLRPYQGMEDLKKDHENVQHQFSKAMKANYASDRPVITVADEAHLIQNNLKLRDEYEAPLMRGAPVCSEWSLIQRGRFMSYLAYDAPEHIFIFFDPDRSNVRRYSEIGGVDPELVQIIVSGLRTKRSANGGTNSEALYIKRSGPEMMIVGI